jgi:hypothetical protein
VREIADVGEWGLNARLPKNGLSSPMPIEQTKWMASPEFRAVLEEGDGKTRLISTAYKDLRRDVGLCLPPCAVFRHV